MNAVNIAKYDIFHFKRSNPQTTQSRVTFLELSTSDYIGSYLYDILTVFKLHSEHDL